MRHPDAQRRLAHGVTLGEEHGGVLAQLRIIVERRRGGDQIHLLFQQHGLHGAEARLHHGVIALVLQARLVEHGAHGDIDSAARRIGGEHLALEVGDGLDAAVGAHHELVAVIALRAIDEFIGENAQVVHARVLDGEAHGGEAEQAHVDFIHRQRGDHGRRALEAHGLQHIGLAEILGDASFGEKGGRDIRRRDDPGDADLQRLGAGRKGGGEHGGGGRSSRQKVTQTHDVLPWWMLKRSFRAPKPPQRECAEAPEWCQAACGQSRIRFQS